MIQFSAGKFIINQSVRCKNKKFYRKKYLINNVELVLFYLKIFSFG